MKYGLLLLLLTYNLVHAQQGNIDMHGGKENLHTTAIYYGKILEIKSAMGYKYLKVDENGTTLWVAIANAPVNIGDKVGYDKRTIMKQFKSKTLGETFESVIFASEVYLPQKVKKAKSMREMLGLGNSKNASNPHQSTLPFVEKEFYLVEEVFMWRKSLQGKVVKVKGSIYKVSHQIMKRDWVHVGDGSGNEKRLTDDLVFTIPSTKVKEGDKVIATGTVRVDKDFGYGYFYKVILDNTSFQVK